MIQSVSKFHERARNALILILYTAAARYKGTPLTRMPKAFYQRDDESMFFPAAFDKFYSGKSSLY